MGTRELELSSKHEAAAQARREVAASLSGTDLAHLTNDAQLVVSELVGNALLHGAPPIRLSIDVGTDRVRVAVFDTSPAPPGRNHTGETAMTGRGLMVVEALTVRRGVERRRSESGKQVWAELSGDSAENADDLLGAFLSPDELIDAWADADGAEALVEVDLGEISTKLLLAAKVHTENLVRELALTRVGAEVGPSAKVPEELARLIATVTTEFGELRRQLKEQALAALERGEERTHLRLRMTPSAMQNGERYLEALDEADAYCRAGRLLSLETPPQHKIFRRWYIDELTRQVRRSLEGLPSQAPQSFEDRLLDELNVLADAERAAGRADQLAFLADAGKVLAESLDHEQTLRTVAAQAVSTMADWCAVYLAERRHIRTVAVSHVDEDTPYDEWDLDVEFPADRAPAGVPRVIRTGQAELYTEVTDELLTDTGFDKEQIEIVRGLDIHSALTVPMTARGRTFGAIVMSRTGARPRFDEGDLAVALGLAQRAAMAIDNAVLYQHENDVAQALQRRLLPPALPSVPGFEVAAAYRPAAEDVGGDFYDLWPLEDGVWGLAVGDVCGTGADAAGFNSVARATLRALSITGVGPAEWLRGLNAALLLGAGDEPQGERFCTVVAGTLRLDGQGAVLRLATGGHPPPILRRPTSGPVPVRVTGTLIGVFDEVTIGQLDVHLEPGDQLVLYTDGVTDMRRPDGTILGERGLLDLLGVACQSGEALVGGLVDRLWSERPPDDDVALLVLAPRPAREAGPTKGPAPEAGLTKRPARKAGGY